jgi:hypothetical protein
MGGDRGSEHGDRCQAGEDDAERVCGAGGECVAVGKPDQGAVSLAKAAQRLLLTSVNDELGRAAKELDELGGQLPLRSGPGPGGPAEESGDHHDGEAADQQSRRENHCRDRQDRSGDPDRGSARQDGHERRSQPSQVQGLQGVDIPDHATHEIAAPVRIEACRG